MGTGHLHQPGGADDNAVVHLQMLQLCECICMNNTKSLCYDYAVWICRAPSAFYQPMNLFSDYLFTAVFFFFFHRSKAECIEVSSQYLLVRIMYFMTRQNLKYYINI